MRRETRIVSFAVALAIASTARLAPAPAGDVLAPLDLRQVKVGGEIGRRIEATLRNNLLVLDADRDFLPPFRAKSRSSGYIGLDPSSLSEPVPSDKVRPGGITCRLNAWKPGFSLAREGDLELTLTEFPEPDGKATYFRLRDFSVAVDDELFAPRR